MEGKSVLIVDDSDHIRGELRSAYSAQGFKVVGECINGLEAIEFLEENPNTDLVSLDVIMPEMDGIECYRKIRELGLNTRVLIVTALASESRFISAFEEEIKTSHFLSKELLEDELLNAVSVVMADEPLAFPKKEIEDKKA